MKKSTQAGRRARRAKRYRRPPAPQQFWIETLEPRALLSVNVLTWHNDNTRQGLNGNEVVLTPANVNSSQFGELISYPVSGQVYAQPLYVSNLSLPGLGTHNVVFVATMTNDVYAFDADSNSGVGAGLLWHVNLGTPAAVPSPFIGNRYGPDHDTTPFVGITSTPVIDLATDTMYLDAFTNDVPGQDVYSHHIHALDLTTGADKLTPMLVAASVHGNGVGGNGATVPFTADKELQRVALTLLNGVVYAGYGAFADTDPYHGWILGFSESTLQLVSVFNTTPNLDTDANQGESGLWQSGAGLASDGVQLYTITGNGDFNATVGDYGDSFIAVMPDSSTQANPNINGYGLEETDYFAPFNEQALADADADLGSGGPMLVPDQAGPNPHEIIGAGKQGIVYVVNRNTGSMGQHSTTTDNVIQEVSLGHGEWGSPAYFNSSVYYHAVGDVLKRFTLTNGLLSAAPAAQSSIVYSSQGGTPSISANGATNGIVWDVQWDASHQVLHAYDATTLAELYNSNQNTARDQMGAGVKFITPTIADGHVFVGSSGALTIYGLLTPVTTPPPAPTALNAAGITSSRVNLTWVDNADNESGFKIERSTDGVNFSQIALVSANVTSYVDNSVIANTQYQYRIRATNVIGDSAYSNTASTTTPPAAGAIDFYHFDAGTGVTVLDSSGANTGTLVGNVLPQWITPGESGSAALSFSGNGVYNSSTSQSAVQLSSNLASILGATSTLDVWIKTTQVGSDLHYTAPAITGVDQTGGANDIDWGAIDATGRIGLYVGDSGGVFSTDPINDGQWHNIAMTRDATTGVLQLYVDGVLNATGTSDVGAKTAPFKLIGALSNVAADGVTFTGGNYFNGQLDEVSMYNQVLGPNDIAGIALAPRAPTLQTATVETGPVIHLTFTNPSSYALNLEVDRKLGVNGTYAPLVTLSASATSYDDTTVQTGLSYYYIVKAIDAAGTSASSNALSVTPPAPSVVARYVFYNNSTFDGQNGSSNLTDLNAIATDKQALLPGGTATFQNYTSFSKGITGIIIDVANLVVLPRPDDFDFRVGNDNNPDGWAMAPTPYLINTYPGRGVGGSTQITVVWNDNVIQNEWLKVTLLAQPHLGLLANDVFYFGNAIGDTGDSPTDAQVTSNDAARIDANHTAAAAVNNIYDVNRDGVVDSQDSAIASNHLTTPATSLTMLSFAGTIPTVAVPASAVPDPTSGTTANLSVLGADLGGEPGLTYTWAATGAPPAAVDFSANGTNAAKNSTVTFAQAGLYNLQVTMTNAAGYSTTSSVSVQVNQTLTSVQVTPANSQLAANTTLQLAATALDQFGLPMTSQPTFTWSLTSGAGNVNSAGVFTASRTAGTATLRATATGGMFGSTTLTVFYEAVGWYQADASTGATLADSSPNHLDATLTGAATFGTGVSGNALTLSGGYASLPTGIVSGLNDFTIAAWVKATSLANWARIFDFGTGTNVNMFLTADAGGTNALRFAITTNTNANEQQVNGPALALNTWTHVAVTLSGNTATMYVNGVAVATNTGLTIHPTNMGISTQNYLGKSQYADPAFNGSIDDFRIYSRALNSQEVLQLAAPTAIVGAAATPLTNSTMGLSVLGSDVTAGEPALVYTWATTGTPPAAVAFSANGTNAAKNVTATFAKAGNYTLQVTIANPVTGRSALSTVNLTVAQIATSVSVSTASASVAAGAAAQLTAAIADQFGNPMASQATFTWSIVSGSGSVNASGLYLAPGSAGSATVRATSSTGPAGNTTLTIVSPQAWYQANATSGTTLTDSSGNNKTGTLTGAAAFAAGVAGNALSLTGGNANLPTGIVSSLNDFTIAAWVNPSSLANWARVFDFGTGTTANMFLTDDAGGTNAIRFAITTTGGGGEQHLDGPALPVNTWTHIAVTLAGNTATLYVDGVAVASNANMTIHPASLGSTTQNFLGKSQYPDPAFQGEIDDFRIYGAALSAQQILQLASPIVINPATAAANPVTTTATTLSVLGADVTAGESSLSYIWSTVGTPPAPVNFSVNNFNSAKNTVVTFTKPGTYNFQVIIVNQNAGLLITSNTSVTVTSTLAAIAVSPTGTSIFAGQTQPFTATALDQFGAALSVQPSFTWSTDSGSIGSVDANGVYTAPIAPIGTATVRASSGAISGASSLTTHWLQGDLDGNGKINTADITALMGALANLGAYISGRGIQSTDLPAIADMNGDGHVTNADLQGLIVYLANSAGSGSGAGSGGGGASTPQDTSESSPPPLTGGGSQFGASLAVASSTPVVLENETASISKNSSQIIVPTMVTTAASDHETSFASITRVPYVVVLTVPPVSTTDGTGSNSQTHATLLPVHDRSGQSSAPLPLPPQSTDDYYAALEDGKTSLRESTFEFDDSSNSDNDWAEFPCDPSAINELPV